MTSVAEEQNQTTADIIFINGDIYTGAISVLAKTGGSVQDAGAIEAGRAQAIAVAAGKSLRSDPTLTSRSSKAQRLKLLTWAAILPCPVSMMRMFIWDQAVLRS